MKRMIRHRYSWPSLRDRKSIKKCATIDEDPFAHFISHPEGQATSYETFLDAGISNKKRSRSLSPFRRKRHEGMSASSHKSSASSKLLKWVEKMEKNYIHRSSPPPGISSPIPSITVEQSSPPVRGRTTNPGSNSRNRSNLRTPPRKPRAWREPSQDIWPVAEEAEDIGLGIIV